MITESKVLGYTVNTRSGKDERFGWRCVTTVEFDNGKKQLTISTYKSGKTSVVTRASVGHISEDGRSISHLMFGDFRKDLGSVFAQRVSEKVVVEAHEPHINAAVLGILMKEIEEFYIKNPHLDKA